MTWVKHGGDGNRVLYHLNCEMEQSERGKPKHDYDASLIIEAGKFSLKMSAKIAGSETINDFSSLERLNRFLKIMRMEEFRLN